MSITLLFAVLVIISINIKPFNCLRRNGMCDKLKLDNCTSNILVLGNPSLSFPETIEETDIYCRDLLINTKCMKDYTKKCLDKFPRQAISLLTYSIGNYFRNTCEDKQNYTLINKLFRCINSVKINLDKCFANSVQTLTKISHIRQSKYKMPHICCNHWVFSDCNMEAIREESNKQRICTQYHVTELEDIFASITKKAINNFCGHYSHGSKLCINLFALNLLNSTAIQNLPKTIFHPLIDIVLSF